MNSAYSPPEEERKQDEAGHWLIGGGSARPQGDTHEGAVGGLVGLKRQMQTIRATARPATKEEKADQQGHSEENSAKYSIVSPSIVLACLGKGSIPSTCVPPALAECLARQEREGDRNI